MGRVSIPRIKIITTHLHVLENDDVYRFCMKIVKERSKEWPLKYAKEFTKGFPNVHAVLSNFCTYLPYKFILKLVHIDNYEV